MNDCTTHSHMTIAIKIRYIVTEHLQIIMTNPY
jgi:hypothetical protein